MNTSRRLLLVCTAFILLWSVPCVLAQGLPTAKPESLGLSAQRLERIGQVMQQQIDDKKIAGAVALVARHGKVAYIKSLGERDIEAGQAMTPDTIFRIASMTKPITSVAVLMLYEEGRFQLKDPVSLYLPEFKGPKVVVDRDPTKTVPANREITIRDLLTHTSGIVYPWDPVLGSMYADAGVADGLLQSDKTLAQSVAALAKLPLLHQPGAAWTYGLSVDVLGRLVEVISGQTLADFFQQRIFAPLAMDDTFFYLPPEKVSRLAAVYRPDGNGGLIQYKSERLNEGASVYSADYPVNGPRKYYSGGAGLCSTVSDYARFMQMLLNRGELDGARLLSPKTVDLMTTDHVGMLRKDFGFGLGVAVTRSLAESGELGSIGSFGWGGFWYTTFFIDPQEQLIGVCMAQLHPSGSADLNAKFATLAYQAIVE